ncbi:MAG: hypothetical protein QY304_00855 [Candidatus Paceibacterota bacterium]|nr:MAG: hypothetical protein QY304_00855 [Candidatus Paceibacterota bacterium]
MKDVIKEILTLAVNAPSGHNSQPWTFEVKNNSIFVYNVPDKDKILFNWKQRGSMIAHGALIENIAIISSEKGYRADIKILPNEKETNLTAEIKLEKSSEDCSYRHLSPFILKRTTNRRPYEIKSLGDTDREALKNFMEKHNNSGYEILLTEDREKINQVVGPFSAGDRLLFENFYVHKSLFDNVNWTLKEEREKREGLYLGTKELNLAERFLFKYIMSKWSFVENLNKIGFAEKAGEKRAELYKKCSAMGLVTAPSDSPRDFINSGRVLERFWLTVTSLGLSFQPVSVGLLYLGQRCKIEKPEELTPGQFEYVRKAYGIVENVFNVTDKIPTFSFRIGYAPPPSASSLKKLPEIV